VRDVAVLTAGAVMATKGLRIEVRWIGKVATFALMLAIPAVSWGSLGLWPAAAALAVGWPIFVLGIVEYYVAAGAYANDLRRAMASR
jgi:phosphatidylglycerophosphate synthase